MYLNGLYVFYITLTYNLIIKYTRVILKIYRILIKVVQCMSGQAEVCNVLGKTLDMNQNLQIWRKSMDVNVVYFESK